MASPSMQISLFKVFSDLAETASFSQAARRNEITQSAVSQQIKSLESRFDIRLIERGKKKFALTSGGKIFLDAAREILSITESIDVRLRELRETVGGNLRLATILSIGLHDLPAYTRQFTHLHPQVKIHTDYFQSSDVYTAVLEDRADAGFVAYPMARRGLKAELLWHDRLVLICSPSHRLARQTVISLSELVGEKFIAFKADLPTRRALDRVLRSAKIKMWTEQEFDNIETVKRTVEIGDAVSILPASTLTNERRAGSLIPVDIDSEAMWRPVGVITRRNRQESPALSLFLEGLRSGISDGKLAKSRRMAD